MNQITIYYDYVCPYCLLAKVPFEESIKGKDVEITYIPFELIEEPNERIDIVNDPKRRADWKNIIIPKSEELGLGMSLPHIIPRPYTRMAIEGSYYARECGKEQEYHARMFRAFFVEGLDIGNVDVLTSLVKELGLDAEEYKEAVESRKYSEQRVKDVRYAKDEVKVKSIPTYVINGITVEDAMNEEEMRKLLK